MAKLSIEERNPGLCGTDSKGVEILRLRQRPRHHRRGFPSLQSTGTGLQRGTLPAGGRRAVHSTPIHVHDLERRIRHERLSCPAGDVLRRRLARPIHREGSSRCGTTMSSGENSRIQRLSFMRVQGCDGRFGGRGLARRKGVFCGGRPDAPVVRSQTRGRSPASLMEVFSLGKEPGNRWRLRIPGTACAASDTG